MKTIQRWSVPEGTLLSASITGWYVSHTDHLAALTAQDAEIKRLRNALEKCEPVVAELTGRSAEAFSTIDSAMSRLIKDAQNATDKRPPSPIAAYLAELRAEHRAALATPASEQKDLK